MSVEKKPLTREQLFLMYQALVVSLWGIPALGIVSFIANGLTTQETTTNIFFTAFTAEIICIVALILVNKRLEEISKDSPHDET